MDHKAGPTCQRLRRTTQKPVCDTVRKEKKKDLILPRHPSLKT